MARASHTGCAGAAGGRVCGGAHWHAPSVVAHRASVAGVCPAVGDHAHGQHGAIACHRCLPSLLRVSALIVKLSRLLSLLLSLFPSWGRGTGQYVACQVHSAPLAQASLHCEHMGRERFTPRACFRSLIACCSLLIRSHSCSMLLVYARGSSLSSFDR